MSLFGTLFNLTPIGMAFNAAKLGTKVLGGATELGGKVLGEATKKGISAEMDPKWLEAKKFEKADRNADEVLGRDEWKAAGGSKTRWDLARGKDDQISLAEYQSYRAIERKFEKLDRDGDGKISRKEFVRPSGMMDIGAMMAAKEFARLDRNGSGNVSLKEYVKNARMLESIEQREQQPQPRI